MLSVILAAAGKSTRMQGIDKLKAGLGGIPVIAHSLRFFESSPLCDEIIVVTDDEELRSFAGLYAPQKLAECISGGSSRAESVKNGLLAARGDFICIHDAARPNIDEALFARVFEAARLHGAAIAAIPVCDTLKRGRDGFVAQTEPREGLFRAQTPQIARREWLLKAYAQSDAVAATDDAELLQRAGFPVFLARGGSCNFKLTEREDMALMQALKNDTRTGCGFDAHRLVEGRRLILGGVEIPFEKGLLGHSDADVLLHAICDALLGAAALGDIGSHFPDSAAEYKDISSLTLLHRTGELLHEQGFGIVNIDGTMIAEQPKLAPYIGQMRRSIAEALQVDIEAISVKVTTTEGMGFAGSGEGIAAAAVCTISRQAQTRCI